MENYETIILYYIVFIWFVIIHTFEEISQGIFDLDLGRIQMSKKKYLFGASMISTVNLGTLALLVSGNSIGLYIGIFTSSVIGILQALVHTVGFWKEGRKPQNIGAGFYTSLPLALAGGVLLYHILLEI
ncbi:MAG: hypothetical protein ABFS17_10795 [Chloroflexota bacterium]